SASCLAVLAAEKRDYEADQAVCQAFFLKKLESFKTVQLIPLKPELSFRPTWRTINPKGQPSHFTNKGKSSNPFQPSKPLKNLTLRSLEQNLEL
ncbi:hypothetical protein, partial [Alcaligenes faecalis]